MYAILEKVFKIKLECKNSIKEIFRTVSSDIHFPSFINSIIVKRILENLIFMIVSLQKNFSFITGISEKAFHFPKSLQVTRILDFQVFASCYSCLWAESIDTIHK